MVSEDHRGSLHSYEGVNQSSIFLLKKEPFGSFLLTSMQFARVKVTRPIKQDFRAENPDRLAKM